MYYKTLYTIGLYLLTPLVLARLLWRSFRAPAYRSRIAERFGYVPLSSANKDVIWVHAVSVGETLAAVPLVRQLQQRYPDKKILVTTTTPTGSERVKGSFGDEVDHAYFPYDLPGSVQRFVKSKRPSLVIIMETELWPNLLFVCANQNIPVVLANARLSEKSAKGYRRLAPLTKFALGNLAVVAAQNRADGERFLQLGLSPEKLLVTGSIKFDLQVSPADEQLARCLRYYWSGNRQRTVWIAASTHPGEDEILLDVYKNLKKTCAGLLLVIVPRHPERFERVFRLALDAGWNTVRRSEHPPMKKRIGEVLPDEIDVVVGDSMGEMLGFFGAADIAFVGGSLVPVGGHNLVEPAVWSLPILTGHHLHNFAELADGLEAVDALYRCHSTRQLEDKMQLLLNDSSRRSAMGINAFDFASRNRGALEKLTNKISELVG